MPVSCARDAILIPVSMLGIDSLLLLASLFILQRPKPAAGNSSTKPPPKKKAKKDKNAPKRNVTDYMQFCQAKRAEVSSTDVRQKVMLPILRYDISTGTPDVPMCSLVRSLSIEI